MRSTAIKSEELGSTLRLRYILGVVCVILGAQDAAAWAQFISFDSGWLMHIAGGDWLEPVAGIVLIGIGAFVAGPNVAQCFSVRDEDRKIARQSALLAGFVAGLSAV